MSKASQIRPPGAVAVRPVRPISELDVPLSRLDADLQALAARKRIAELDKWREGLPLDHPYRHTLDVGADTAFARIVSGLTGGAA